MSKKNIYISILFIILFSYVKMAEIRLIPILVLFSILHVFYYKITHNYWKLTTNLSLLLFFISLTNCLVISIFNGSLSLFASMSLFLVLAYWPLFIEKKDVMQIKDSVKKAYVSAALLMTIGIIIQVVLYKKYSYIFGLFNTYGDNRTAFGFLWNDYSFLSLFLVSAIPFLANGKINHNYKWVGILLLILSSLMTSARTGITALIFIYSIYFLLNSYKILSRKSSYIYIFIIITLIIIIITLQANYNLINRSLSTGGSGRIEGYIEAVSFFRNNLMVGAYFDEDLYENMVGTIPHNFILYVATIGGIPFIILITAWLLSTTIDVIKTKNTSIKLSYSICITGMLFIPSIFSTYFFAILISIVLLNKSRAFNP